MALKHAGSRVVGLHAVTDQVQNYKQSGFGPTYSTWRYTGVTAAGAAIAAGWIVDADQVGLAALVEYDAQHFRATRPAFLQAWTSAPGHVAKVAVDHDGVVGFGVIRPTAAHARIGPLYARDTGTARALLRALTADIGASTVALDAPETNRTIEPLAAELDSPANSRWSPCTRRPDQAHPPSRRVRRGQRRARLGHQGNQP